MEEIIKNIKEHRVELGNIKSLYTRVHKPDRNEEKYEVYASALYESQDTKHFKYSETSNLDTAKITTIVVLYKFMENFPNVHKEIIKYEEEDN
ncbi:hypothetical protein BC30090_p413 (plasmid) [Bacillus cereus]|uniref:hypothetical protein n=1 Tax=Bacillus TaxID=1386 RepID=UPI0013D0F3FA|nr:MULTISPECIES: hypothetical protein [Bacillus]NEL01375.1 hypothetical protein [Bacillus mobilis]BCD26940.1 hypothetical protein BC30090_p413 [Bacillus cereus]